MATTLTTAPTIEPVTLAEAKAFCRVDTNDDDSLFATLIRAARLHAEKHQQRALINQTWTLVLDGLYEPIELPYPPLSSVTTLKYLDSAGDQQTLSSATYTVSTDHEPGRITLAYGKSWPTLRGVVDQVEIAYVAGYGATPDTVPHETRLAILQLVSHWYVHRGLVIDGMTLAPVPMVVDALLDIDRIYGDI
jgi:uncharacterized phiE125 gp8 family phage protein